MCGQNTVLCLKIGMRCQLVFASMGLSPHNPWQTLVWEALITLPSKLYDYQFLPTGSIMHCFTDGSVSQPQSAEDALASWAVVVANVGPLAWGPLPGLQQSIPRAEAYALLCVVIWSEQFEGTVHIWSGNQGVVDHARDILRGIFCPADVEHEDLWISIQEHMTRTSADLQIHKVASHDRECQSESPVEDFMRIWNDCADAQAHAANVSSRPAYFQHIWGAASDFQTNLDETG